MAIKASPETIREMKEDMRAAIEDMQKLCRIIREGTTKSTEAWNDAQAESYKEIMQRIEKLSAGPVDTLQKAMPKLESLAQALEDYQRIHF